MKQNQSIKKTMIQTCIVILSVIGLITCVAVLFPQVRHKIVDLAGQILNKDIIERQGWLKALLGHALGGICFILFFDYCTFTGSGRALVQKVLLEIKDCLSEIHFRSYVKPVLLMSGVYLLGIFTIIRANFLYYDDVWRSIEGSRNWYDWNRYVSEFTSIFIHGDTNLTDISPLPQLLAVLLIAISSVLLVYIIADKKITTTGLLASIPLGLSPYFLGCLSFKFDAPYMSVSVLASIIPFLFIERRKAFLFISIVSLFIMCMSYQAASGIYLLIVIFLGFRDWMSRKKTEKEILSFWGIATLAFCFTMLAFRFFLMKPTTVDVPISSATHPLPHIISGLALNIKNYAMMINNDFGMIWKICIGIIVVFFITKSIFVTTRHKTLSFFVAIAVICVSFILSYGVYLLLEKPLFEPRALYGFGVLISILSIYVVSDYKKIAKVIVLALSWCFLVFAFSYGNALAEQERYGEFRRSILFHDLSTLFPDRIEGIQIQLENSIAYAPSIKNISKHYPIIERLVPIRLGDNWDIYYLTYYHHSYHTTIRHLPPANTPFKNEDFRPLNLPVVLDSYYHTVKSDGNRVLVILKH